MGLLSFLFPPSISAADAHERVSQREAVILDVRERREYRAGHAPGSKNMPLSTLAERTHELPAGQRVYVAVCRSGTRSRSATAQLRGRRLRGAEPERRHARVAARRPPAGAAHREGGLAMSGYAESAPGALRAPATAGAVGPIGRLGAWTADHIRAVALAWAVVALALGAFAPKVETALSGAGWQANGSESVQARDARPAELRRALELGADGRRPLRLADGAATPAFRRDRRAGRADPARRARTSRRSCRRGRARSISRRRPHRARAPAAPPATRRRWSPPPTRLKSKLAAAGARGVTVSLTGASGMWSDFNTANRKAMMRSELFSWPVTLGDPRARVRLARRRRAAADADDPRPASPRRACSRC